MKTTEPSVRASCVAMLLLMAAPVRGSSSQCGDESEFCCDARPQCRNVSTLDMTLQQFVESTPHYELILSSDEYSATYEGVCDTYFRLGDDGQSYLTFRVLTTASGISVSVALVSSLGPGVFRQQGLFEGQANYTSVFNAYVVDASCKSCQPLYIFYKCYIYDTCDYVYDTEFDDVNGRSSSPAIAPSCLDAFDSLVKSEGLNVRGFTRPPGDYNCVARYLNSTCVNYEKIAPNNMISYPLGDGAPGC